MTQYELDASADQIVHWLMDETAGGQRAFDMRATRDYVSEPAEQSAEAGLDDHTGSEVLITLGVLEVWPTGLDTGWRLQVTVQDIVGPHTPEEESVPDGPEEIDLADFEADFIAPDRGTAFVTLDADTPQAKSRFDRLFADLLSDRHAE